MLLPGSAILTVSFIQMPCHLESSIQFLVFWIFTIRTRRWGLLHASLRSQLLTTQLCVVLAWCRPWSSDYFISLLVSYFVQMLCSSKIFEHFSAPVTDFFYLTVSGEYSLICFSWTYIHLMGCSVMLW